jgi:diaminopimelate epimerase
MIEFIKMHCNGNSFIITYDKKITKCSFKKLNQNRDLKFDQLLVLKKDDTSIKNLEIFNRDGTPALNCINGKRCIKALLNRDKPIAKNIKITVKINNYEELFDGFTYVDTTNHHIISESKNLINDDLENEHKKTSKLFNSDNFNFSVYNHDVDDRFLIRTFEAGVGETLSCGSGSSATAFIIFKRNPLLEKVFLNSKGGQMICYKKDDDKICTEATTEIICKSKFDEREYF